MVVAVLCGLIGCRRPGEPPPEPTGPASPPEPAILIPDAGGSPGGGDAGAASPDNHNHNQNQNPGLSDGEAPAGTPGDRLPESGPGPDFRGTLEALPSTPPAAGRDGLPLPGRSGCEGGIREVGERWSVGCNTCTCEASGEVSCTLMACTGEHL